ncbi:hypothetical protein ABT304_21085 [Nocardioides sp. NPDC000445]|uniref:hypothetical protein n=1 Tax=Nocardioides sp. NPDC000445 TaxID=3154257 RepID=UPI00331EF5CF
MSAPDETFAETFARANLLTPALVRDLHAGDQGAAAERLVAYIERLHDEAEDKRALFRAIFLTVYDFANALTSTVEQMCDEDDAAIAELLDGWERIGLAADARRGEEGSS